MGLIRRNYIYYTFNTVRMIKSRRMRWERLSKCFEGVRNAYKIQLADLE
jgi:hypothetical protein